jgi:hypothetical protein
LTEQFNSKYTDSIASVESQIEFTFEENTFFDPENNVISYKAYVKNIDITNSNDLWIKFYPKERKFIGKAPRTLYLDSLTVKVIASDGFSEVGDVFTIKLNEMPLILFI